MKRLALSLLAAVGVAYLSGVVVRANWDPTAWSESARGAVVLMAFALAGMAIIILTSKDR